MTPTPPFTLQLFGAPRVVDARGRSVEMPLGKPLSLLVHLACEGGMIDRERLGALFWPEASDSRHSVRQGLLDLRRTLGVELLPPRVRRAQLRPGLVTTDAAALGDLSTRHHAKAFEDLVRGPFCHGLAFNHSPDLALWYAAVEERTRKSLLAAARRVAADLMLAGQSMDAGSVVRAASRIGIPEPELRLLVLGRITAIPTPDEALEGEAAFQQLVREPSTDGRPALVLVDGAARDVDRLVESERVRRPGLVRLDLPGGAAREERRLLSELLDRVADLPGGGGRSRGTVKFHAGLSGEAGPAVLEAEVEAALREGLEAVLIERPLMITIHLDRVPLAIVDLAMRAMSALTMAASVVVGHSSNPAQLRAPAAAALAALAERTVRVRLA